MNGFFERVPYGGEAEFHLFSSIYFITIFVSVFLIFVFYKSTTTIKKSRFEKIIRCMIASIMLLSSITIWAYAYNNNLPWYKYVPEATCGWAIYLGGIMLLTKNRTLFVLVFFWGWGALSTIIAPAILDGPTRYNFYQFFLRHILIIVSAIYMMKVFDFKIYKKDFKIYFFVTLSMTIIGAIISLIVNKPDMLNMFYMMQQAVNNPIMEFLIETSHLLYVVVWLSIASLIGYIYGLPFYSKEIKK